MAAALAACSGDDDTIVHTPSTPGETPDDGGDPQTNEPLYAVGASVFGEEGSTSYVALVPSLDASVEIDYSQVLELGSASTVYGPEKGSLFAVGLDETPTITKYEVTGDARLLERETLDFTNYGLTYMWRDAGLVPFLSETKAYVLDARELQVVIWDPAAMVLAGSFSIDGVEDADYPVTRFEPDPTFRGDEMLVMATHSNEDVTAPFSTLIRIDTRNDRVTSVVREERCGGLWDSVMDSRGDIYFSTGVWDAAQNRVLGDEIAAAPCIVRVKAGETTFDPDFFVPAASIGGYAAGGLVAGGGDVAYIKVLNEAELPEIGPENFEDVWGGAVWRWWRVELGSTLSSELIEGLPASNGGGGELYVEGRAYVRNAAADFSNTTLVDMGGESGPSEQLELRGYPYGIVRLR